MKPKSIQRDKKKAVIPFVTHLIPGLATKPNALKFSAEEEAEINSIDSPDNKNERKDVVPTTAIQEIDNRELFPAVEPKTSAGKSQLSGFVPHENVTKTKAKKGGAIVHSAPPTISVEQAKLLKDETAPKVEPDKKSKQVVNSIKEKEAPKSMGATENPKKSSSKEPSSSAPNSGILATLRNWINPERAGKVADPGLKMEAYYDKEKKVWVFPGDDPAELAKPLAPPPTTKTVVEQVEKSTESKDPLAAMMAPPPIRTSVKRHASKYATPVGSIGKTAGRGSDLNNSTTALKVGMSALQTPLGVTPPQFTVFKPPPFAESTENLEKSKKQLTCRDHKWN